MALSPKTKKGLTIAGLVLFVYVLFTDPLKAADWMNSAFAVAGAAINAITTFFGALNL